MKLTIDIPGLPPRELSPNARVHWATKAKAVAEYIRIVGWCACIDMTPINLDGESWIPPEKAKVSVTFVLPNHRRRDMDNLIASFKPGMDALGPWHEVRNKYGKVVTAYGAGVLKDDNIEAVSITYSARVEKGISKTIVEVEA